MKTNTSFKQKVIVVRTLVRIEMPRLELPWVENSSF